MLRDLAILPLILLLSAPVLAQRGDVVYDQSFDFRPGDALEVSTSSPNVVIQTGSRDGARVRVIGRGPNVEAGFEHLRFSAQHQRQRLRVRTDSRGQLRLGRAPSFTIEVTVPERANLRVSTSSGSVRIENISGNVEIAASSGSVSLANVDGDRIAITTSSGRVRADRLAGRERVEITTSSGGIQADRVTGNSLTFRGSSGNIQLESAIGQRISARTSSGNITIGTLQGPATLNASSGSVRADGVRHPLEVGTSSGSVQIGMAQAVRLRASASSGSVTVRLPATLRTSVDLSGRNIQIDEALGLSGKHGRRSYRGTMNGGGEQIVASTSSGRIRLTTR
jgi:DUF4097 and DUF4098 domain-containing protein YvlB